MASASRRMRRANGIKGSTVSKAMESGMPLNALYALIPENKHKALERFVRCFGLDSDSLNEAMEREKNSR